MFISSRSVSDDRPDDERREELDGREQEVDGLGRPGREERVLEEPGAPVLDAGVDEGHVRDERQQERQADHRGAGDVEEGDDAREVHAEDQEEDGHQDREEPAAVLLAEDVLRDVDADEVDAHLHEVLAAAGDQRELARAHDEQDDEDRHHQEPDEHDAVEVEARALEEGDRREELRQRGSVEPLTRVFSGEGDDAGCSGG